MLDVIKQKAYAMSYEEIMTIANGKGVLISKANISAFINNKIDSVNYPGKEKCLVLLDILGIFVEIKIRFKWKKRK